MYHPHELVPAEIHVYYYFTIIDSKERGDIFNVTVWYDTLKLEDGVTTREECTKTWCKDRGYVYSWSKFKTINNKTSY